MKKHSLKIVVALIIVIIFSWNEYGRMRLHREVEALKVENSELKKIINPLKAKGILDFLLNSNKRYEILKSSLTKKSLAEMANKNIWQIEGEIKNNESQEQSYTITVIFHGKGDILIQEEEKNIFSVKSGEVRSFSILFEPVISEEFFDRYEIAVLPWN